LPGSGLAQVREVFLADALSFIDGAERLLKAAVLDRDLEMHFGFAAEALYMRCVLALIGADGAAERFVIGEDGAKAERKNSGEFEAVTDHARVVFGCLLIEIFLGIVFGDDDCEITGWVEEDLIP
jgi:hypothetical protein